MEAEILSLAVSKVYDQPPQNTATPEKETRSKIETYLTHAQHLSNHISLVESPCDYTHKIWLATESFKSVENTRPLSKRLNNNPANTVLLARIELAFANVSMTFNGLGMILTHSNGTSACGVCSAMYYADRGVELLNMATVLGAPCYDTLSLKEMAGRLYEEADSIRKQKTQFRILKMAPEIYQLHRCEILQSIHFFGNFRESQELFLYRFDSNKNSHQLIALCKSPQ